MAASAALLSARRGSVLLVDLAGGDQARILGVEPSGPGLQRWLRHPNPPPDALARLELAVAEGVALLPFRGSADGRGEQPGAQVHETANVSFDQPTFDLGERFSLLAHLLADEDRLVIVDLGLAGWSDFGSAPDATAAFSAFFGVAERSTLVVRLCYLALAAAMARPVPDDVIVVAEPDRALRMADVTAALGVPVASVRWDPSVARAVDSGLLSRRLPRALHRIPVANSSPVGVDRR